MLHSSYIFLHSYRDTPYTTARDFSASLGLVPKQNSTGGKTILGGITKKGDRYARTMLIQGARSIVIRAKTLKEKSEDVLMSFAQRLLEHKCFNQVAVAVANKMARIAYAVTITKREYGSYQTIHNISEAQCNAIA